MYAIISIRNAKNYINMYCISPGIFLTLSTTVTCIKVLSMKHYLLFLSPWRRGWTPVVLKAAGCGPASSRTELELRSLPRTLSSSLSPSPLVSDSASCDYRGSGTCQDKRRDILLKPGSGSSMRESGRGTDGNTVGGKQGESVILSDNLFRFFYIVCECSNLPQHKLQHDVFTVQTDESAEKCQ